jgi:hypothetical protein
MADRQVTMEFLIKARHKLDEIAEMAIDMGLENKLLMVATVGLLREHNNKILIESIYKIEASDKSELMTVLGYIAERWTDEEDGEDTSSIDYWLKY